MATLIEVRNRIQGVKNTQKITRAMKIVAATKLRKNENAQRALKPLANEIDSILKEVGVYKRPDAHPLMVARPKVQRVGYVVIASDRGLCGAFNANLFRQLLPKFEEVSNQDKEVVLYVIGLKALRFFEGHSFEIAYSATKIDKEDKVEVAEALVNKLRTDYESGVIDEANIIYNQFSSAANFGYAEKNFLPIVFPGAKKEDVEPIYENSFKGVLSTALPMYLKNVLLSTVLESMAAEEASRMLAMDYATENSKTMIGELSLFYNRTRQATITREISEIVGGAEALNT
jgi:F-type H+-transporting ATPase subunit gamma